MTTINDVADALCTIVTAATGLPCTQIVDMPNPPQAMVYLDQIPEPFFQSMARGVVEIPMVVAVIVASTDIGGQQRFLNDTIGPYGKRSIPQAIFQNPTLGTDVNEAPGGTPTMTAHVVSVTEYGFVDTPAGRMLQAKLHVNVRIRGDR